MNKILDYNVTGQNIELASAAMLVAGTVNEYTARFAFDADWDGYQRIAVFNADGTEREQLLTDDTCKVPWEVLIPGAYLKVGVYGTKNGSRLPTIWTSHRQYIHDGAGPTEEAAAPSPVLAEQILQRMGDLDALKTEDKSSLVAAINEVWSSGGSGGSSVTDAFINEDGHLIITLSTGELIDAGYAVGPVGPIGPSGADGKTAYQYAKDGGYTGTEAEFAAKLASEIPAVDSALSDTSENPVQNKVIKSALDAKVGTEELNKNSETLGTLTVKDSDGNVLGVYDGGSKEIVIPASTGGGGSHAWNLITNLSVSDAQAEHQITVDDSGNAFAYDEILVWYPSPAVSGFLYFRGGVTGAESTNCKIWLTAGRGTLIQFSLMGGYVGISSVMRTDGPVGFSQGLGGNATMDKIRTIVIGASAGFTAAGTIQIYGR